MFLDQIRLIAHNLSSPHPASGTPLPSLGEGQGVRERYYGHFSGHVLSVNLFAALSVLSRVSFRSLDQAFNS
ncbi:hypothetical protein [Chroococcidiopsis sp. CCMEE 29]|uniref:hypothetical protein n=1 Tax=Chroococcidiopsis sp. CCMEE 29 TaxID=155894 RepID=UPI002020EE66|nr:hypothetical protein [Chroococcidiopsis sp. CCMEE 29]